MSIVVSIVLVVFIHGCCLVHGGIGGMGMGGMGMGMTGMGLSGMGGMGMGKLNLGGMGGMGGKSFGQSMFNGGNKKINDEFFKDMFGKEGFQFGQGSSGFAQGGGLMKNLGGNSGFYSGMNGGKNMFEEGGIFQGGQYIGQQGENKGAAGEKKGHKKGYVVKGYKTSHQTDEASNTEENYDEESDEAAKKAIAGENGQFEKKGNSAVQGEKNDAKFNTVQEAKKGQFEENISADKAKAEAGKYGGQKYAGDGSVYSVNNGGNLHNNAGHHEANKFHKHYPIYY